MIDLRCVMTSALMCLAMALPAVAQGLNLPPTRQGMVRVAANIWIDGAADAETRRAVLGRVTSAQTRVAKALGQPRARPEWRICTTVDCNRRNGMTENGMSYGALLVAISAKGATRPRVFVHEQVHVELHRAAPLMGLVGNPIPNWFDEGLATLISRTNGFPAGPAECRPFRGKRLPNTPAEFNAMVRAGGKGSRPVYRASACAVRAWLSKGRKPSDAIRILRAGGRLP